MKNTKNYARAIFYLLTFLCVIAGAAVLKITAPVILPVLFSIMLGLAMLPLVRKLNHRFHIPWNLASFAILFIVLVIVYAVGSLLISSLHSLIRSIPDLQFRFAVIYEAVVKKFKLPFNDTISIFDNLWNQFGGGTTMKHYAFLASKKMLSLSRNLILVVFLILFLLAEIHRFREKIDAAFNGKVKGRVIHVFNNIILQVTRFISIKFIVSLMTGVCVTIGTFLIGVDFPVLWGFIAFVLNFIPYFGSAVSCALTILFAILQFYPKGEPVLLTAAVMLGTNMIIGNIIEPNIVGRNLGLSPFIVLISLSLWGWLWGFSGMLLAVPATVILKIICENISFLHPVAIFLGDRIQETQRELSPPDDDEDDSDTKFTPGSDLTVSDE